MRSIVRRIFIIVLVTFVLPQIGCVLEDMPGYGELSDISSVRDLVPAGDVVIEMWEYPAPTAP